MKPDQIRKDISAGQAAAELMDSQAFRDALASIEADIFDIWKETKTNQSKEREEAWLTHRAMELLKAKLQSRINAGKVAMKELDRKK